MKINKNILNKINKLEEKYPPMNFDIQEHIIEFITPLEEIFKYNIRDRIKIPNYSYIDEDSLDREILGFLTEKELNIIVDTILKNKK